MLFLDPLKLAHAAPHRADLVGEVLNLDHLLAAHVGDGVLSDQLVFFAQVVGHQVVADGPHREAQGSAIRAAGLEVLDVELQQPLVPGNLKT